MSIFVKMRYSLILIAMLFLGMAWMAGTSNARGADALSAEELHRIGSRIWQNECAGTVDGLTSWNVGENFASLGIGHFIWYPAGVEGPFEESFPKLVAWYKAEGVPLPAWLASAKVCPWPNRAAFMKDHDSERQRELRKLLSNTVPDQTRFIIHRLHQAIPRYREASGPHGAEVEAKIAALTQSGAGNFAMIDYINFKGDGLNPKERYQGEGWGLLQVLLAMPNTHDPREAPAAFASAAKRVLTRRVELSPPARHESRWLEGWKNRCDAYRH